MYDLYTSLIPEYQRSVDFETAKQMVLAGLTPLGEEYLGRVKSAFAGKRIDVDARTRARPVAPMPGGLMIPTPTSC